MGLSMAGLLAPQAVQGAAYLLSLKQDPKRDRYVNSVIAKAAMAQADGVHQGSNYGSGDRKK